MKKAIALILIAFPLFTFCQNYSKSDIIGEWRIIKAQLYIDGGLVRTGYLKETSGVTDTIINGPEIKKNNQKLNEFIQKIIGSKFKFSNTDSFDWDLAFDEMKMTDKYWTIIPNTNEIIVNEWADKNSLKGSLMSFIILKIENGKLFLDSYDSDGGFKFDLERVN